VADIVRQARMSSRTFYEHFASKEELVVALVDEAGRSLLDDVRAVLEANPDPRVALDRGIRVFLDTFARTPLNTRRLGATAPLRLLQVRRSYLGPVSGLVEQALAEAHGRGLIAHPPDPLAVEVVLTGLEGTAARLVEEGRAGELEELHPRLVDLLARAWF